MASRASQFEKILKSLGRGAGKAGGVASRLSGGPIGMALLGLMLWPELKNLLGVGEEAVRGTGLGRKVFGMSEEEMQTLLEQAQMKEGKHESDVQAAVGKRFMQRDRRARESELPEGFVGSQRKIGILDDILAAMGDGSASTPPQTEGGLLTAAEREKARDMVISTGFGLQKQRQLPTPVMPGTLPEF